MPDTNNRDIIERIHNIETQVVKLVIYSEAQDKTYSKMLADLHTLLTRHDHDINGNGNEGLKSKLATIEDKITHIEEQKKTSEKHALVAWTAGIGLIIKSIWDLIAK